MNGPPDEKFPVCQGSRVADRDAVLAQVDAVGPRRERHVKAIVDDHSDARLTDGDYTSANEPHVVAGRHPGFTNLHDVDAAGDCSLDLGEERIGPCMWGKAGDGEQPAAISDEAESQPAPQAALAGRSGCQTCRPARQALRAG